MRPGRTNFENAIRGEGTTLDYDVGGYAQVGLVEGLSTSVDLGLAASIGAGTNKATRHLDVLNHSYEADYNTARASFGAVLGVASAYGPLSWGAKADDQSEFGCARRNR